MVMDVTLCVCVHACVCVCVCVCVVHVCVRVVCVCLCVCERERERDLRRLSFMKSTEVQTSPMLASRAQLLGCGIHMLVALNATKYVIITEVSAFFQTFRGNLPLHLNFPQNRQLRT